MSDIPRGANLTPPPLPGSQPQEASDPNDVPGTAKPSPDVIPPGAQPQSDVLPKRPGFKEEFDKILNAFLVGKDPSTMSDEVMQGIIHGTEKFADKVLDDYERWGVTVKGLS